ncbi:MAG TPA: hypothetical protein VH092_01305 [Urbifossiella sp.]|nr:hypothetical protein [Urbifossiella sp.]
MANLLTRTARGEAEEVRAAGRTSRDQVPSWERDLFRQPKNG